MFSLFSFPDSSVGKESTCNAGGPGSIPGLGRSAGEGIGYPLQYTWASLVAQLVKNPPVMQETQVRFLIGKIPWRREVFPLQYSGLENIVHTSTYRTFAPVLMIHSKALLLSLLELSSYYNYLIESCKTLSQCVVGPNITISITWIVTHAESQVLIRHWIRDLHFNKILRLFTGTYLKALL